MLVSPKQIAGALAQWAIRQSPYAYPDGLEAVVRTVQTKLCTDEFGFVEVENVDDLYELIAAVTGDIPELVAWNQRKNGNPYPLGFVSRYERPDPDNDFIDLGALWGNAARTIAAEEREHQFVYDDASGTSGSAQDRNGLDPKGAGPTPKGDAQGPSA